MNSSGEPLTTLCIYTTTRRLLVYGPKLLVYFAALSEDVQRERGSRRIERERQTTTSATASLSLYHDMTSIGAHTSIAVQ